MADIKRMSASEFRELGYLQEVNRLFLHPLGLALEVVREDDSTEHFGSVWDYRDDPEGIRFDELGADERAKAEAIAVERRERALTRAQRLGYVVQPFDYERPDWFWELEPEARARVLVEAGDGELSEMEPIRGGGG